MNTCSSPALLLPVLAFALPLTARNAAAQTDSEPPARDPNVIFSAHFDTEQPGPIPPSYFVVDGNWSVAEIDGGRALKLAEAPLVDAQVQFGESLKDNGGTVSARIKTDKKRRSLPRFGVGMHGITGYRLRLFPATDRVELVRNEEVVAFAELVWDSTKWWHLELTVEREKEGSPWQITGRAWPADGRRPGKAQLSHIEAAETKFSGKASIAGTAFAGLPLFYDDLEVKKSVFAPAEPASKSTGQK